MIPMDYVAMFQYGSHMTVGGSVSKYRVWLKKWISIDNSNCEVAIQIWGSKSDFEAQNPKA